MYSFIYYGGLWNKKRVKISVFFVVIILILVSLDINMSLL